jgi:hypothetical protein
MTIFKIPKVAIHIPGATSRLKFAPEYVFPIYKRMHPKVADPSGDPVRIVPHPKDIKAYNAFWHEIEADSIEEAMAYEMQALRSEYGLDLKGEDYMFDQVYNESTFPSVFMKAFESAEALASDPLRKDPADAIYDICKEVGVDEKTARTLAVMGLNSLDAVVLADVDQLARLIGKVRTVKLIAAANKKIDALCNATPAEQIAGAKAKAK